MDKQNDQATSHPGCFVCGKSNPAGLSIQYCAEPDGCVTAHFCGSPEHEGYPGVLHGGIIATVLDGAMTHCLFAHGQTAMTVELNVRYRAELSCCQDCTISAKLEETRHGVFRLSASLVQNGAVKALATGKFISKPGHIPQ